MVTSSAAPEGQERRDPTTTLTGWRQFVDTDPASFTLLAGEQLAALTGQGRAAYDEARLDYHSEWWWSPPRRSGRSSAKAGC